MQSRQHQQGRSLRKLTDEQEKEIVYLYEDMSILALAFMWNISRSTVTRILKDHAVTLRPRGRTSEAK
jgi:DNA invertase Pin-like site-specific DNA recombinase